MPRADSGIYKIKNRANGKFYIGSTNSFSLRWSTHRGQLRSGNHTNKHLQSAWNKYGENNFEFEVLEVIEDYSKLIEREEHWFQKLKPIVFGYNQRGVADAIYGTTASEETRAKMSAARKGVPKSKETRERMSAAAYKREAGKRYIVDPSTYVKPWEKKDA